MSKIGIPADRWDWLSGEYVRRTTEFYPNSPGYGGFVDPPYSINGDTVYGSGGWVIMSSLDFARVGLLMATEGRWNGKRLISKIESRSTGVGANTVQGWGTVKGKDAYISFGKVATGFQDPKDAEIYGWIVGPVRKGETTEFCNFSKTVRSQTTMSEMEAEDNRTRAAHTMSCAVSGFELVNARRPALRFASRCHPLAR